MKAIKFMGLFLVIASMTSCQKENIDTAYNSDPSAVKLTATVGSPFTRSNPLGDGAASIGFNAGDRIAVTAQGQEEIVYTLGSDGNWTPEAGKYHKWTTETMSFTAYYPARYTSTIDGDNNASLTTFNLPLYQGGSTGSDTDIARADYMTFSGNLTKGINGAAAIALTRQMARVRVVVASVGNEIDANDATFYISISTQHTAIPANNDDNIVYPANGSLIRVGDVSTGLVIPGGALNNRSFIQVLVYPHGQSGDLSGEYPLETLGIPAMEAGKSYTYNLKVGKEKIELENVTVADWNTGTAIPGGEAELMATIGETGVAAPRLYVDGTGDDARLMLTKAPTNPGAFFMYGSLVAINAMAGSYAAAMVIFNPTATASFDAWDDIPYANEEVNIDAAYHTVANVTAGKGDPCRLVGYSVSKIKTMLGNNTVPDNGKWRLPTNAENGTFGTTRSDWTDLEGINGRYFGTEATDYGTGGEFLPAAGYRDPDGKYTDQYINGNYWSNMLSSSGKGYNLYFSYANVFPQDDYGQFCAMSVRCVPQ